MSISRRDFSLATFGTATALRASPYAAPVATAGRRVVANRVTDKYVGVPYDSQKIEGLLGERMRVNLERRLLAGVDIEILLAGYRHRPGQQTWIGEHLAKFIDAATNVWSYSRDEKLKTKLDTAVRELLATQTSDGYLGTYAEAERWKNWDLWAHKYNLIALLNYYAHTGYEPALKACRRVGDLLHSIYGEGKSSIVLNDWHVGMANTSVLEGMVNLYRFTGEPKYLDFCRYIVRAWDAPKGPKIISTLLRTGSVRDVANNKAYEMMSNFVGLLELYRTTGEIEFLKPVQIAWDDITEKRLYITGTTSWDEHFTRDGLLRADEKDMEAGVGEGCVTTTWMQINLHLLRLTGEARYAAQLERTIYNALLAAQHPDNGQICYFVALNGRKYYGGVSQGVPGVSCCTSSIPRGLGLIPAAAYGVRNGGPAVNLYASGRAAFTLASGEVTMTATTDYPVNGKVTYKMSLAGPAKFPISLRVPEWSRSFSAKAAGETYRGKPGAYLEIDRNWRDGDTVIVDIDLIPRAISGAPTYPDHTAIERGPQVLVADTTLNRDVELWVAGLASSKPGLEDAPQALPPRWKGGQAYRMDGFEGNVGTGRRAQKLVLVPIADAGQLGGEYRTWLKSSAS